MNKLKTGIITLAALIAATTLLAAKTVQPNIVVYMIDDLGWNQISVGQGTMDTHTGVFQTPHLEKLANNGLSFTQAYMHHLQGHHRTSREHSRTTR